MILANSGYIIDSYDDSKLEIVYSFCKNFTILYLNKY